MFRCQSVVKGVNFVNLIDAGDPVEIAAAYDKAGADELVFLDITASSDARNIMIDMVRKVAEKVFIPFTVGGGIRTVDDFKAILREGADKISINSSAINTPDLINDERIFVERENARIMPEESITMQSLLWKRMECIQERWKNRCRLRCCRMGHGSKPPRSRRDPVNKHGL